MVAKKIVVGISCAALISAVAFICSLNPKEENVVSKEVVVKNVVQQQKKEVPVVKERKNIADMYNSTVYEYADVLDTFIYRYGIGDGEFEVGTAVGLFSNVINIALLLGANKVVEIINKVGE